MSARCTPPNSPCLCPPAGETPRSHSEETWAGGLGQAHSPEGPLGQHSHFWQTSLAMAPPEQSVSVVGGVPSMLAVTVAPGLCAPGCADVKGQTKQDSDKDRF